MLGMGVGGMVMLVIRLVMTMTVLMTMGVNLQWDTIGLAGPGAFPLAERAAFS
tara:strand:- start:34 stop:192 length:159 start_codon:yes stop_codon:yes gene_type:complete